MRIFKLRFYTLHLDFLTFHKMVLFYAITVVRSSVVGDKFGFFTLQPGNTHLKLMLMRLGIMQDVSSLPCLWLGTSDYRCTTHQQISLSRALRCGGFVFSKILYRRRLTALLNGDLTQQSSGGDQGRITGVC